MRENVVLDKSFDFAVRVVKLYKYLKENKNEHVLSKQLVRSGTSRAMVNGEWLMVN